METLQESIIKVDLQAIFRNASQLDFQPMIATNVMMIIGAELSS
jgi:hypothetical protein